MSEFLFNVRLFVIPPTPPRRKNFRYAVGPVKQGCPPGKDSLCYYGKNPYCANAEQTTVHLYLLSTLSYPLNEAIEVRSK